MASTHKDDFRAQARQVADKHAKADKRQRRLLQGGIALLVVAVLVIAGLVFWNVRSQQVPDSGPVAASSNSMGGIVLTQDGPKKDASDVQEVSSKDVPEPPATPPEKVDSQGVVEPGTAKNEGKPVQIVVWQDFDCVHCADFEKAVGDQVADLVSSGDATVEYRTVNFLDNATAYSSRAANAYYAVAEQVDSQKALDFQKEMFSHQGTGGLTDQEIIDIASHHGADIEDTVKDGTYRPLVDFTAAQARADGVPGTPTVMVDGVEWTPTSDLKAAVDAAKRGEDPNSVTPKDQGDAAQGSAQG